MDDKFYEDCEKILDEEKSLCIYFPMRTVDTSPRSKIAVFKTTEQIIQSYPNLEPFLTPLTNTNGAVFIIDPLNDKNCNLYVVYGNELLYRNFDLPDSLEIYEDYITEVKVYPFAIELCINRFVKMINDMSPKEFLQFIYENFESLDVSKLNELKL